MKELEFTLKLRFDSQIQSDEEVKEVMKKLRDLIVYGNDNGLITPDESEAMLKSVSLTVPFSDMAIGALLNR